MNNIVKKKIIYTFTFLIFTTFTPLAFEMPIDPFKIEYELFAREAEPKLDGENLVFTKLFDYYGNEFTCNVYFNRRDHKDWYIFFHCPILEKDNFYELYKDVLFYFFDTSYLIYRDLHYSKDSIETNTYFVIDTNIYYQVYEKILTESGLYGFGIVQKKLKNSYSEKIDVVNNYWSYFNIYLYDKKDFNPEDYYKDTVYTDPSILPGVIEKDLKYNSNDLYDGMFFHQWVLRSINNKDIKLKIEVDNIENLKSCILFDNYANLHVMNEFINREIEIPYSDNHIEHFAFIGKLVEGNNKEVVFKIKASCE